MVHKNQRVAIVYDWIDKWGGVERLLLHLHTLFPAAHFFTSAVDYANAQWAKQLKIHTSFLQSFPSWIRRKRAFIIPFFPLAFESFRFEDYDLVISVTSAFAKGIITQPGTKHVCYLLTPPRYLWSHAKEYATGVMGFFGKPLVSQLKAWDMIAARRPDNYISISQTVAERAHACYGNTTPVIYPPFDTHYWDLQKKTMKKPSKLTVPHPYYLFVGRLESYKKADLIVETAIAYPSRSFVVVGTGSLEEKLRRKAPQNCLFTGLLTDEELSYLYTHAEALIMPQNEDFGYVSLEAQYHICPVIAFKAGGVVETVTEGVSGLFFTEQTVASLVSQLERYEQISYNLRHSMGGVQKSIEERFGIARFDRQFIYQLQRYTDL